MVQISLTAPQLDVMKGLAPLFLAALEDDLAEHRERFTVDGHPNSDLCEGLAAAAERGAVCIYPDGSDEPMIVDVDGTTLERGI